MHEMESLKTIWYVIVSWRYCREKIRVWELLEVDNT